MQIAGRATEEVIRLSRSAGLPPALGSRHDL